MDLKIIETILISDDAVNHKILLNTITNILKDCDNKLICELFQLTKPYQKKGNKPQKSIFYKVYLVAKERNLTYKKNNTIHIYNLG